MNLIKSEKWVLYAFILTQIFHSVLVVFRIGPHFFQEDLLGIPKASLSMLIVNPHSFHWFLDYMRGAAILIVLVVLITSLWGIAHIKRWAWGIIVILVIDAVIYSVLLWRYEELPNSAIAIQLIQVPLVLTILIRKMRVFKAARIDILIAVSAVLACILLIIFRAKYLPTNQIEWAIDPPSYLEILVYSGFQWPQENSLALLIVLYLVFRWLFRKLNVRNQGDTPVCNNLP